MYMKCPICNKGELKKGKVKYEEFGIYFGEYPAEVCSYCKEPYFDSATIVKIQEKSKKLGLFGLAKRTVVGVSGNSLAVRIPKEVAKFVHLKKGIPVLVKPESREKITVELVSKEKL